MTRPEIKKAKQCPESVGEAWGPWRRFEDEMIKTSPIRRMAKGCVENMTLVEAAVRDAYREMGIEEEYRVLPPITDPQRGLPSPIGLRHDGDQTRDPCVTAESATDPAESLWAHSSPTPQATRFGGRARVEYVVFKMGRNGSVTPVYSNRPAMVAEIARRQGRDAVARVAVMQENGRQYRPVCDEGVFQFWHRGRTRVPIRYPLGVLSAPGAAFRLPTVPQNQ